MKQETPPKQGLRRTFSLCSGMVYPMLLLSLHEPPLIDAEKKDNKLLINMFSIL